MQPPSNRSPTTYFPDIRGFTGNFLQFAGNSPLRRSKSARQIKAITTKFPMQWNREFLRAQPQRTGKWSRWLPMIFLGDLVRAQRVRRQRWRTSCLRRPPFLVRPLAAPSDRRYERLLRHLTGASRLAWAGRANVAGPPLPPLSGGYPASHSRWRWGEWFHG
jgi:hypothetical protein